MYRSLLAAALLTASAAACATESPPTRTNDGRHAIPEAGRQKFLAAGLIGPLTDQTRWTPRQMNNRVNVSGITTTIGDLRILREAAEATGIDVAGVNSVGGITIGEPGGMVDDRDGGRLNEVPQRPRVGGLTLMTITGPGPSRWASGLPDGSSPVDRCATALGVAAAEQRHLGADLTWAFRSVLTKASEHRSILATAAAHTATAAVWLPAHLPEVVELRFEVNVLGVTTTVEELRRMREAAELTGTRVAGVTSVGGITIGEPGGTAHDREVGRQPRPA